MLVNVLQVSITCNIYPAGNILLHLSEYAWLSVLPNIVHKEKLFLASGEICHLLISFVLEKV